MQTYKLGVIGTGYVGLVTAACLAEIGHDVIALDVDEGKISNLRSGVMPIHEPGLSELVHRNSGRRLRFTTSYDEVVPWTDVVFIAVGTPSDSNGDVELRYVWQAVDTIAHHVHRPLIVAVKSTVPVGTCDMIEKRLREMVRAARGNTVSDGISVVSNPEFLREGRAVADFMKADRIVIGSSEPEPARVLKEIYSPLGVPFVFCDRRSSELIKYASNAFLATKISFINSIARLCERVGADVVKVAEGMGYDHRIMPEHLRAGLGYGGSCFPKDTAALLRICSKVGFDFKILKAAVEVNDSQVDWVIDKLRAVLGELAGKTVAVWGIAFKPNTDDTRESPALRLISRVLQLGATVKAYDPVATPDGNLPGLVVCSDAASCVKHADALVVATEWAEFVNMDFTSVREQMKNPICIDARNCLNPSEVLEAGFRYLGLGRSISIG
ncbi:MAG: UDP-glucose/GDP-mannose dehydrogenase family protein [Candidatus Fermentithermobacillus carboniphilus]|uniref:UDP-glucose 6-dehydrogenase n=1 Tax=Candidatus Fermentithermobacillus carboniphilus TaxID=3085328 RepID=A0AAT9LGN3_9FIRM|nr:MAG: UDP-glucose/GDP-mannose dehydrogenase family protein [Candidatus Fermentithermobacillus carboniphilus]